jgi:pimeloyl-ACP methyl ester carboxylesterase
MARTIRKGFVNLGHRQVHYRAAGAGPPVILLHDSPRSSVLHLPQLEFFSQGLTVIALDTPGYGLSSPLDLGRTATIDDFGASLGETIAALGLSACPVYSFHTSSKILLSLAVQAPERLRLAIMDGLSIPSGPPDENFIRAYMKPFIIDDDGAYLAEKWTKVLDIHRFFPWFAKKAAARMASELPDEDHLHRYMLDFFMAGPHFSDAYAAAMRYEPLQAIAKLRARAMFLCRQDDVLYSHLDKLPDPLPQNASIERLPPGRPYWRERILQLLQQSADPAAAGFAPPDPFAHDDPPGVIRRSYIGGASGQTLVRRVKRMGGKPVLLLHNVPGGASVLDHYLHAIGATRDVYAIELPGCGESDPLPSERPTADDYARRISEVLDALGLAQVDLVAFGLSTVFARRLLRTAAERVRAVVLDTPTFTTLDQRTEMALRYCPPIEISQHGGHLHQVFHMLRNAEMAFPWYGNASASIRWRDPNLAGAMLHQQILAVLKQPVRYADAPLAALNGSADNGFADVSHPLMVLFNERDPSCEGAHAVRWPPHVRKGAPQRLPADFATQLLGFFDTV